ncbi:MAG: hypothetical protein NZL87_05215, partial [Thermomicrobium sp.]|nr:hypothetical protein [Thermomicrobium sp.]
EEEPEPPWTPPAQDDTVGPFDPVDYLTDFETTQPMQTVKGWWEWTAPAGEPGNKCLTAETVKSAAGWNLALWQHSTPDYTIHTAKKRFHAQVRLLVGQGTGWQHNAGVVINYKLDPVLDRPTFVLIEIDWDAASSSQRVLRVARYNGTTFHTIAAKSFPTLQLKQRYWIGGAVYATVDYDQGDTTAWIHAVVHSGESSSGTPIVSLVTPVRHYGPFTGRVGILSQRSPLRVLKWYVNDADAQPPSGP